MFLWFFIVLMFFSFSNVFHGVSKVFHCFLSCFFYVILVSKQIDLRLEQADRPPMATLESGKRRRSKKGQ